MSDYITSLFDLEGKVAVVTGGTGELCGSMAEALAKAGVYTVLVGRDAKKAEQKLERISNAGGKGHFIAADLSSTASLDTLLSDTLDKCGKVDIVINGAGVNSATPALEITEEEIDRILAVNYKGVFRSCQVFGKYLVERGEGGSIINLGSVSGVLPLSRVFTYSASKAAVHSISRNLAREWAPHRVRVNTLIPGFFPAEQNKKILTPERQAQIMGHTPANRYGEAHELAGATLLLASDKAGSFITGHEMVVDGGFTCMTI